MTVATAVVTAVETAVRTAASYNEAKAEYQ
jgi:hypothetical protein